MDSEIVSSLFMNQKNILIVISVLIFLSLKKRLGIEISASVLAITIGLTLPSFMFSFFVFVMGISNLFLKRRINFALFFSVLILQIYLIINTIVIHEFTNDQLIGLFEQLIYLLFFIFIIMQIKTIDVAFNLVKASLLFSIIISLVSFYQLFLSYITEGTIVRVNSLFGSPNTLGLYSAVSAVVSTLLIFNQLNTGNKKIYKISLISNLVTLLLTMSRAAWVAFIVVEILIFILIFKRMKLKYLFLVIVIGAIGPFLIPEDIKLLVYTRVMSIFDPNDLSSNDRLDMIKGAVKMISNHPFFGNGFRTFQNIMHQINIVLNSSKINHPHNTYLELLQTNGILGFFLYAFPIIYVFLNSRLKIKSDQSFSVLMSVANWSLLLIFIYGFFDRVFFTIDVAVMFWFLLGLKAALSKISEYNNLTDKSHYDTWTKN